MIRVCEASDFGGPSVLRLGSRPDPVAGPGEVVVSIAAAGVNPSDLAARSGAHRARMPELTPPFVPGWDLSGVVRSVGPDVAGFAAGDPVLGMIPWIHVVGRVGAYASAAAVDAAWLAMRPAGLDDVTAATIPLNALTALQALELIGADAGSSVLVTGASGAVGGYAVQLAVASGLRVLAVASDGDADWVASLGAAQVLSREVDYGSVGPVDALLDAVPVGPSAAAAVRDGGVAVFTRRVGDVSPRLRVETPLVRVDAGALSELARAVAEGRLRARVARTLDLADGARAHELVEAGGLRGKVVLTMGSD